MTDLIKSARELAEAATSGPWRIAHTLRNDEYAMVTDSMEPQGVVCYILARTNREAADKAFIAASRDLVPALCDEVERLRTALEKAETDLSIAVEMVASLEEATGENLGEEDGAIMDQIARDMFARRMTAA